MKDYSDWGKNKADELNFWRQWMEKRGRRYAKERPLWSSLGFMIGKKKKVSIADIGSGAISVMGSKWETAKIKVFPSDILADEYAKLAKEFGIKLSTPIEKQDMTKLTYKDNTFDIVHCSNALDHCYYPRKAILEMLRVCKPKGWVYLKHVHHEGKRRAYRGLHTWNIDITENGDCEFWRRGRKDVFLLSDIYDGFTTRLDFSRSTPRVVSFVQKLNKKTESTVIKKMDTREYLHKKFNLSYRQISPVRIKNFRRGDLAKLFNKLSFKKGAEVGVFKGHYSLELCKSIPNLELLCVDSWETYEGKIRLLDDEEKTYQSAKKLLAPYNAKLIKAMSMDAVRDVAMESLDFVYIDGHHGFDYVIQDLIEWSKRIKTGGIVSGHDYYRFKRAGVVPAVNTYTHQHKICEWFITDERRPSFFWVKK